MPAKRDNGFRMTACHGVQMPLLGAFKARIRVERIISRCADVSFGTWLVLAGFADCPEQDDDPDKHGKAD